MRRSPISPAGRASAQRASLAALLLFGLAAPGPSAAAARMLRVAEAELRGAKEVGAFLAAAKVREATLTACLKGQSGLDQINEIQAFLEVSPEGSVRSTSVQGAGLSDLEVDICLMEELSRTRFPAGEKPVAVVLRLRPDPKVDPKADAAADGAGDGDETKARGR